MYRAIRWLIILVLAAFFYQAYHDGGFLATVPIVVCYFLGYFARGIQQLQDAERQ